MGKIFYNLGFLSTETVVFSTETDLIGQNIGPTATKAKAKLGKALGKVMVIDDAYQIDERHYASKATDELIKFLSLAQTVGRIVYHSCQESLRHERSHGCEASVVGTVSGRLLLEDIKAEDCIALLHRDMRKRRIKASFPKYQTSAGYTQIWSILEAFRALPSWGNARPDARKADLCKACSLGSSPPPKRSGRNTAACFT